MQSKTQLRYDRVALSIIVNSAQSIAFNYIAHSGAVLYHFGSMELSVCLRQYCRLGILFITRDRRLLTW